MGYVSFRDGNFPGCTVFWVYIHVVFSVSLKLLQSPNANDFRAEAADRFFRNAAFKTHLNI